MDDYLKFQQIQTLVESGLMSYGSAMKELGFDPQNAYSTSDAPILEKKTIEARIEIYPFDAFTRDTLGIVTGIPLAWYIVLMRPIGKLLYVKNRDTWEDFSESRCQLVNENGATPYLVILGRGDLPLEGVEVAYFTAEDMDMKIGTATGRNTFTVEIEGPGPQETVTFETEAPAPPEPAPRVFLPEEDD